MKITIYELLGMIKDGKAPKKIKYQDEEYTLNKICLEDNKTHIDYYLKGREILLFEDIINIVINFNDEVEIIKEEKKIPEKIDIYEDEEGHYFIDKHCKKIYITCDEINFMVEEFNQLIDYLESKGE